jgi:5-methyltetrahydropteroyltriglutamate--homocysteine methyltransferase
MEKISTIIRVYNSVKRKGVSDLIIGNNTLFDFIPEVVVVKKLKLLKKLEKVESNE